MILMCPYCSRKFVVPPHREAEPAQRCPNCSSSFEVERGMLDDEKSAPAPAARGGRKPYPDHQISPHECEVVEELSRDGAGILYLARHPEVKGLLALKAFLPEYAVTEAAAARWTRACRLAVPLEHQRLAKVLGVGLYDEVPCLLRQYIDGESLRTLVEQGVVDPRQAAFLTGQVLEGLEYVHSQQLTHGNVKPSNIIVDRRGRAVLCDLGLYPGPDTPEEAAHFTGSWPYQSPEVLRGEEAGPQSDVYSTAAVLYQAATGQPPFEVARLGDGDKEEERYTDPRKVKSKVSAYLSFCIHQGLSADPKSRYPSAHPMQVDVKRAYKGEKPLAFKPHRNAALHFLKLAFYLLLFCGLVGASGFAIQRQYKRIQKGKAEECLKKARRAMDTGHFSKAVELAKEASGYYPPLMPSAYVVASKATLAAGNFRSALDTVSEALDQQAVVGLPRVELQWLKAVSLALLGSFGKAEQVLGELDDDQFRRLIGDDEIKDFLAVAVQVHKTGDVSLGAANFLSGRLLELAEHNNTRAILHQAAATLLNAAGEGQMAADRFRKALQAGVNLPAAARGLRAWLEQAGLPIDEATTELFLPYPRELALLCFRSLLANRPDESRRLAAKLHAIENLPEDAARILALTEARQTELSGNREDAMQTYLGLSARDDLPGLWGLYSASVLSLEMGRTGEAERGLALLLGKPDLPPMVQSGASLYLGHSWRARGKSDQSIVFYRKARDGPGGEKVFAQSVLAQVEAYCETRALDEAETLLPLLDGKAEFRPSRAAAAYLLGKEAAPPSLDDEYHARYVEALRLEVAVQLTDAYRAYDNLRRGGEGKSWYASAALFRLDVLRRKE